MLQSFRMKYFLSISVLILLGILGYAWWSSTPKIDSTNKIHADLYEGASDSWDPHLEITPFERAPTTALTVRWQAPEKIYNHFLLTISNTDGTILRKESGEHDRLSLDLDALEPATEYIFNLQACLNPRCESWIIAQEEYRGTTQALATQTETETTD